MEINTAIEIQGWADFDIVYTECIMVHSDKKDPDQLLKQFMDSKGLSSEYVDNTHILHELNEELTQFLYDEGFTKLKTNTILFTIN